MSPEEEVTRAEEAPPYNKLTEDEKPYALFTDGSCRIVGKHRKWKAAVWSPTRRVAEAAEGQGESSQFAEVKAIQLALDIAEREKWPTLYLYTDSWMVANALWGWLQQWKRSNWQRRGKPIWAAPLWQDIAAWLEKLVVKVRHVDAHVPKSRATEEHRNNQQVDQAAKIEVAQVDLDWQRKGELFIARWAHDTSGHQGRDATYRWARDRGVDLSMDAISQVIHQCETCAVIKQAKRVKPLWYGGRWLKYKYGEAWQIDYITLPQSRQGKRYVLTMVEVTTGWLETYPVPHATARNTILGLEKQVLWRHGTPERIESDNGTHFRNNLIDTWAKEHGIEWVYHIPYHAPASGKIESAHDGSTLHYVEHINDNFFLQVIEEPMRRGALHDLILTNNKKGLVGYVKVKGNLSYSADHKMVEFRILRKVRRVKSKITALNFKRSNFGLFRDLFGRVLWSKALEGREAQESWLIFEDHLL
ncbi:hypothetical protein GRJ2_001727500 [Grus japonensis]|uniref:Uncharacterized protein n=1 Tax=Grus japonensis TaxID=30415 RepID=A0ABC9X6L3_GRUJA